MLVNLLLPVVIEAGPDEMNFVSSPSYGLNLIEARLRKMAREMEDDTLYLLFAVVLFQIVCQHALSLEYTDTAESCKEQAQLTATVTRLEEQTCGMNAVID